MLNDRCKYTRHLTTYVRFAALWLLTLGSSSLASDVLLRVEGNSFGQGTLMRHGNECLIMTPKHVVFDTEMGIPVMGGIDVVYGDRTESTANVHHMFDGDLALLRLDTQPLGGCMSDPLPGVGIDRLLDKSARGVVMTLTPEGATRLSHVNIVSHSDYGDIEIRPTSEADKFEKGFSGGILYLDDKPAGMLVSVNEGTGKVLSAPLLQTMLQPFLSASTAKNTIHISLDETSRFLEPILLRQAQRAGMTISEDSAAANRVVEIRSRLIENDTDTGKLARIETTLDVFDALQRPVLEQAIESPGNSFVDMETAIENARIGLVEKLETGAFIDNLP